MATPPSPTAENMGANKAHRLAKRLLILGWDAADWIILDQLFEQGRMPNLRKLIENGVRADLRTLEPKLSPILWTTITTGKTCEKHGILNFVEPKPDGDGLRVIQSTTRKTKALWNILSQTGHTTNVIGWYASHPAEPIRGRIVSNLSREAEPKAISDPWPLLPGVVHPGSFAAAVAASRQRWRTYPRDSLRTLLPRINEIGKGDDLGDKLEQVMAYATSVEAAARLAMAADDWDVTMIFFDAIDTAGHQFMEFRPPRMEQVTERQVRLYGDVMDRVYEWHDESLGRLLNEAGPDTTVILISDHGFHSGLKRPNMHGLSAGRREELESSWHRPFGVLVASGPGVVAGATAGPCSLLDIAPTALALVGLAAGEDMDGRVLREILDPSLEASRIPSWDTIDGDAGMHPADLRQDPIESNAAIQQLVDLGYLAGLPEDAKEKIDMVSRSSRFNLAVSFMSRQCYTEAIPLFAALMAERPSSSRYGLCLIQCQNAAGAYVDGAATARSLLERDPGIQEYRLLLAHALAGAGDITASILETEVVEREAIGKPELANGLSALALLQGRYDDSARHAARAVASDPQDTAGHLAGARAALAQGRFEEAAGHALDALEITQAIPEAHHFLGVALAWYGDLADALQSLDVAIQYEGDAIESHRFAALVAAALGDGDARERHRAKVLELSATPNGKPQMLPFGAADFASKHGLSLN
ncbi:MAG: alkaline phosphatase family protein [Flavobacteriales bacterium]